MFAKLLKPNPEHPKAEVRLAAVQQLESGDPEQHQVLVNLAQHDPDLEVRLAAIGKVVDIALLSALAADENPGLNHAVKTRLAGLLNAETEAPLSEEQRLAALAAIEDPALLIHLADSTDGAIRRAAIARFTSEEELEHLVITSTVAKIRLAAAEKIQDPERLQRIARFGKQKDNGLYQSTHQRLTKIKEAEAFQAQQLANSESLCEELETLADVRFVPANYGSKLNNIQAAWNELEIKPSADLQNRFDTANVRCREKLEVHEASRKKQLCCETFESQSDRLQTTPAPDNSLVEQLDTLLDRQEQEWQQLIAISPATEEEQQRYTLAGQKLRHYREAVQRLLQHQDALGTLVGEIMNPEAGKAAPKNPKKQLQHIINAIKWPPVFNRPAVLAETDNAFSRLEEIKKSSEEQQKHQRQRLQELIEQLSQAVEKGLVQEAKTLLETCQSAYDSLAPADSKRFKPRLTKLRALTQELSGWRKYAENQQRVSLCKRMEELAQKTVDAQDKVNAIKQLQGEWKALDQFEAAPPGLWRRFQKAGEAAYAPCKQHFEHQAKQRESNLEERTRICREMKEFFEQTDWRNTDVRALDKKLRHTVAEWRRCSPVDRKPGKALQTEFDDYISRLKAHLKDEHQSNLEIKRALIKRAEAQAEQADLEEAMRQIKELQAGWREAGPASQRQEQSAWKQFRAACDVIYNRLQERRNTEKEALTGNKQQAEAICEQIETLCKSEESLAAGQKQYQQARDAFRQVGALPDKAANALRKRFNNACKQYEQQARALKNKKQYEQQDELLRKTRLCQRLELLAIRAPENSAAGVDDIRDAWATDIALPKALQQRLEARFNTAGEALNKKAAGEPGGLDTGFNKDLERAQQLCLRAEIVADIESPADVRDQRMRYQLSLLGAAMTGGIDTHKPAKELVVELLGEWCSLGPIEPDAFDGLEARLKKALDALNKKR